MLGSGYDFAMFAIHGDGMTKGDHFMSEQKQRPANVPEENVYNGVHWLVIATYVAAIGGVAMLMMGAG